MVSTDMVSIDMVSTDMVSLDMVSTDMVSMDMVSTDMVSMDMVSAQGDTARTQSQHSVTLPGNPIFLINPREMYKTQNGFRVITRAQEGLDSMKNPRPKNLMLLSL